MAEGEAGQGVPPECEALPDQGDVYPTPAMIREHKGQTFEYIGWMNPAELKDGVNFVNKRSTIVYKDPKTGEVTACANTCRHQGGKFKNPDIEDSPCVLTCSSHGWRLDVSTMDYVHPRGHVKQTKLMIDDESGGDSRHLLYRVKPARPWAHQPMPRTELEPDEFTITHFSHACAKFKLGKKILFSDPWLVGPAFSKGWWLTQTPPADWLDQLATADVIYMSHNHSDHLNLPTLELLAQRNPDALVIVPGFSKHRSCEHLLSMAGMRNVRVVPFGVWQELGEHGRYMLLIDASGRDDSAIYIEYKGHTIFNYVDCNNPNNGEFPRNIDVMMGSFASGASGYPQMWEQYDEAWISEYIARTAKKLLHKAAHWMQLTDCRFFIPFAGYFTEAHPQDHRTHRLNIKNTSAASVAAVASMVDGASGWAPVPGGVLDMRDRSIRLPDGPGGALVPAEDVSEAKLAALTALPKHNLELWDSRMARAMEFSPLQSMDGVREYFNWVGYLNDNLVLHVIETDVTFTTPVREFFVDFGEEKDTLTWPSKRPEREHNYLRMKVRADVFRHVLAHNLSWEEISIGFQAMFYREPDSYNFDFWSYYQNILPREKPLWDVPMWF